MASLYHHSSFPLSPPHQLTAPEPPRAPPPSYRISTLPSSPNHGSALPRPAVSFACHCKAPPRDHDTELLRALQSNGNGALHGEPGPPQVLNSRSDEPGGDGRSKRSRLCARDCAKRIMELPVEERVKVLDLLQRDDAALTVSDYNDILSALARAGDHASALALFRAMPVAPDAHSFATAVQCLCRQGAPDEAKLALDEMLARGFRPSVATFSAVVGCLCKRGRVTKAMEVFDAMRTLGCEPTIRTYNSLVGGLCYVGRLEEALDLLNKLKDSPKTPDIYTFTIVLDGRGTRSGRSRCSWRCAATRPPARRTRSASASC
ncbi:Pentatricopeptide repeat-containing protein [Dichanthelium oligosanthes]|uniref:Pentatricopeptide repeat-containing protein n=1 Tax=Dichanthelium oligosanthes TaxID=888268 RepID=A0A1E5UT50_9POAL|nr:Pentatricopeptide repeat-containing protein [Dichanthelium oligosanthes]